MRKFLVLAVLVFLAWWLFVRPGSTEFGCEAAAATAHAASDDCPSSAEAAAGNSSWAADRMNSISDSKLTTGLLYDSDGTEHALTSGYDDDADRVTELLDELGAPFPESGPHPAAAHVEPKAAAQLRDGDQDIGVMVINNEGGVCSGRKGLSCQEVLPLLLAAGTKLYVWSPGADEPVEFEGRDSRWAITW
ncbi:MAG: DddA-like double-stranded DNA deaminase toxin [Sciscionella sp.]